MKKIQLDDKNLLIKRYTIRKTGRRGASLETTIPREVFAREARRNNMTVDEAIQKLKVVFRYGDFEGVFVTFELPNSNEKET